MVNDLKDFFVAWQLFSLIGESIVELVGSQSEWSEATFGPATERGPMGTLKHLEKEANEAWQEAARCTDQKEPGQPIKASEELKAELADCLILLIDATWRSGLPFKQLVDAAKAKMEVNKSRQWSKPTTDGPVEHVR